jgi:hypothetical protein
LDVTNNAVLDADTVRVDLSAFQSSDIRNLDNSIILHNSLYLNKL